MRICWLHFQTSDFKSPVDLDDWEECSGKGFGHLKKGVVPSQRLPEDPGDLGGSENIDDIEFADEYQNLLDGLEETSSVSEVSVSPAILHDHNYTPIYSIDTHISRKRKSHHAKDQIISHQSKQIKLLKNRLSAYESGTFIPKTLQKKACEKALVVSGKFTSAQLHQVMKPPRKIVQEGKRKGKLEITRCKNWAYEDYAKAIPIKNISKKALNQVKDILELPLPGFSTCNKKFWYG